MKGKEGEVKYAPWKGRLTKAAFESTREFLKRSQAAVQNPQSAYISALFDTEHCKPTPTAG